MGGKQSSKTRISVLSRLYHNRTAYLGYPEDLEVNFHLLCHVILFWYKVLDNDTENLHFPGVGEKAARSKLKSKYSTSAPYTVC